MCSLTRAPSYGDGFIHMHGDHFCFCGDVLRIRSPQATVQLKWAHRCDASVVCVPPSSVLEQSMKDVHPHDECTWTTPNIPCSSPALILSAGLSGFS